jgi:hypothetical protein
VCVCVCDKVTKRGPLAPNVHFPTPPPPLYSRPLRDLGGEVKSKVAATLRKNPKPSVAEDHLDFWFVRVCADVYVYV